MPKGMAIHVALYPGTVSPIGTFWCELEVHQEKVGV